MRCSKARELISDVLDARLDESRGIKLTRHLDDCADCQQHQAVLERGQALLRANLVETTDNFEWKVQLKIQQALREKAAAKEPASGWSFWRPALVSAVGVALVVVFAGGMFLTQEPGRPAGDISPASVPAFVAESSVSSPSPVEPDLSGGVRRQPLKINTASGGFGIRTVADEGFIKRSPLADPVGTTQWRQEGIGETFDVRIVIGKNGQGYYMVDRRVLRHGAGLNLNVHQFRLREVHPVSDGNPTPDQPDS
jgi:hypothetical protein